MSSRHVGRKTAADWQDSYYALEQRFLALQKDTLRREQEIKLQSVAQRRAVAQQQQQQGARKSVAVNDPSTAHPQLHQSSSSPAMPVAATTNVNTSTNAVAVTHSVGVSPMRRGGNQHASTATSPYQRNAQQQVNTSTSTSLFLHPRQTHNSRSNSPAHPNTPSAHPHVTISAAAPPTTEAYVQLQPPAPEAPPPLDPRLVWGADRVVEHMVQAQQLHDAAEALRRKLHDAEDAMKLQQHDIGTLRQVLTTSHAKADELTMQLHQAVRERDMAAQKLSIAQLSIQQLEQALQTQVADKDRLRAALEGQLQDLRTRLLVSADSNEGISKDVRSLLTDVKEKNAVIAGLQARLTVAENSATTQKNSNQSLLVELRNLNDQLIAERRRSLAIMREAQVASSHKDRAAELERQVEALQAQRGAMEREHLATLDDLVRATGDATARAQAAVNDELLQFREAAAHWQHVAEMMFDDISQRSSAHVACREECEEAKRARDTNAGALMALREELRLANAKLNIVWPTHRVDTAEMDPERITKTYQRLALFSGGGFGFVRGAANVASTSATGIGSTGSDAMLQAASPEELIAELQAANAALAAELEAHRVSAELMAEQLRSQSEQHRGEVTSQRTIQKQLEQDVEIGQRLLEKEADRVSFLEAQVRRLRGETTSPHAALDDLADNETILELFVGQLLPAAECGGSSGAGFSTIAISASELTEKDFPQLFCTVDFLVHETTATRMVRGWSGFLDTTIAFRVEMDALLIHYLNTRGVLIQLHRVTNTSGSTSTVLVPGEAGGAPLPPNVGKESGKPARGENANNNSTAVGPHHHSTLTTAAFRTIAEGSCAAWELTHKHLDEARPTLKGHVKLFDVWGDGRLVASVEFTLTSRRPFSAHFRRLASSVDYNKLLMEDGDVQRRQWRRATHDANLSVISASASPAAVSQASIGPSVSVPKVVVAPPAATFEPITSMLIGIGVVKLALPAGRGLQPPQLALCFRLDALDQDVYISGPRQPTLFWQVDSFHSFAVTSLREVFGLARDPLALFFFDDTDTTAQHYWGAASCVELAAVLAAPGHRIHATLPITTFSTGDVVGEVTVFMESVAAAPAPSLPPPSLLEAEAPQQPQNAYNNKSAPGVVEPTEPPRASDRSLDEELLQLQTFGPPVTAHPAVPQPQ